MTPVGNRPDRLRKPVMNVAPGDLHKLAGGFTRLTIFLPTIVMALVTATVLLRLRAMRTKASLILARTCPSLSRTRWCNPRLRVFSGLLSSSIVGWPMTVWVRVICRRRLLESRAGPCPVIDDNRTSLRVLLIRPRALPILCCPNLNVMPLQTLTRGNRVQPRKMAPIGCVHGPAQATLELLTWTPLVAGLLSLVITCSAAAPLYFEGLSNVKKEFRGIRSERLPMVPKLLKVPAKPLRHRLFLVRATLRPVTLVSDYLFEGSGAGDSPPWGERLEDSGAAEDSAGWEDLSVSG